MRFELDIRLENSRFSYAVSFEWPEEFNEARILEESLSRDGTSVFTRERAQVRLADGTSFRLDWHYFALPVINESPPLHSIQDVKTFLASMMLLAPIPRQMSGFSQEPATELGHYAENYASCLRALLQQKPKAYTYFDSFVREVMPDFASIENLTRGKDGGSQLVVAFQPDDKLEAFSLAFDDLSDGEKCFMLSAYVFASNMVGPPVVCVWDEPDNHLSLSEVGHFILAMRKLANNGGQFIATTHHPETIRKFADENTFVLTRRSHADPTDARKLETSNYEGDLIHALVRNEIIA
jgi:hypothetical protein